MTHVPDGGPRQPLSAHTGRPDDPAWYSRRVELLLYALAAVTYVGLGMFHKFLLNWVIGPVWLLVWIWLVPLVMDRVRRRGRGDGATRV